MKFESITLHRKGEHAYQVTIWSDGVVRWDGQTGPRMGAWQTEVSPDWLEAVTAEVAGLPPADKTKSGDGGSLVVETSKQQRAYPLCQRAEPAGVWRLGMLIDGVCDHVPWAPLDVSGESDFSPWAQGTWMRFLQGAARGEALARAEGLLLLAGSTASTSTAATLEDVYKSTRADLVEDGGLMLVGNVLVLTRHLRFSSPSAPASVLAGSNTNGRRSWRDASGATWAELGFG